VTLLHPKAFERGYPDRPLASLPGDQALDPVAPAPSRLIRRLRARHAVREAAAASLPLDLPPAGAPGLALYPRPVPEAAEWEEEALGEALRGLIRHELFRYLPRRR
jgi:hypothetical protein